MDFKSYVQNVVASYLDKEDKNIIFVKHYNTLAISEEEILAQSDLSGDKVFFYHEYAMHEMHASYDPFLKWIRECYVRFYRSSLSEEEFLQACGVYSLHMEPIAGFIRSEQCTRREDVLYFEINYESSRMLQSIVSILKYISEEHPLVFIISKLHLAPYSTIRLLRAIVDHSLKIHAVLMYNDEFIITDYKKDVWNDLMQAADNQNLQLEWGRMDSERTMDVQDEFWFDKAYLQEYFSKILNMYYMFSLQDAYYYINNIMNRLDEKTIRFERNEQLQFIQLATMIDMNSKQVDQALVLCGKLTDMQCYLSKDRLLRYNYHYFYAKARMVIGHIDSVRHHCEKCVEIAREMKDDYLAFKAKILLWSTYFGIGKDIFEYDFHYKCDPEVIEQGIRFNFKNFLAYMYVFGFENDPESMHAIASGEKQPYYFNLGIQLGTELGNDNFLLNAYMKNIMLYSRSGYYGYVMEMYQKRLAVLRRPNPLRESHMLAGLGYNSIILEDFEQALSYLRKSVLTLTELEQPNDVTNSLYNLALMHFVAEDYRSAASVIELILKMLQEMGYQSIDACSNIKLYSIIAISCYYQKEYYNSYYYLSKMEIIVEHMIMVLKEANDGVWDEDLLLYHLVKGMLYLYENNYELCAAEFRKVEEKMNMAQSAMFFAAPIYSLELCNL